MMIRLPMMTALIATALTSFALAVVRPEDDWFESPANQATWEKMWPVLNDWEFGEQDALLGGKLDRLAGIEAVLGETTDQAAVELGVEAGSPEMYRYDLNLDGLVDQFDVLELGYEVPAPQKRSSVAPSFGTAEWVLLRADFQDESADYTTYNQAYFEERMFQANATKPSCNDYFSEISYGNLSIDGKISTSGPNGDGWYTGEHTKQWYINNSGAYLVYEAVLAADDEIDYSDYDVDGDGYVDTVMLFYPNQVFSGGLWPHRSSGLDIHVDGVIVDAYFITGYNTSNDSYTMVISVHEYGHILGLPDLYDVNGGSAGVGKWSLMAYNYDNNQKVPSLDPWCKFQLGWLTPTVVTDDLTSYSLGCYQDSPEVLKVWPNGEQGDQYFLLANYRKKRTDANRPGEGLMIFHIDDSIGGGNQDNANEDRKHVDVESARGAVDPLATNPKDPLDNNSDNGHANDPFFSGNSAAAYTGLFNDTSNPHSKDYPNPGVATGIEISNISAPGDTMTIDVDVVTADAPTCSITGPTDGSTLSGDATIEATATPSGTRTITEVEFFCNDAYLGSDTSSPYSWTFNSKAFSNTSATIRVVAHDDSDDIDTDTISVTVSNTATAVPYLEGFESGVGDWAAYHRMGWRSGSDLRWKQWTSRQYAGTASAGVGATSGGYDYDQRDELVGMALDLTGTTHPIALWQQRYSVSSGENNCYVFVSVNDGSSWTLMKSYTGSNLSWHPAAIDLQPYAGQTIRLKFRLDGSSLNRRTGEAGWWLDDLEVREISAAPEIQSITPVTGTELSGNNTITVVATDDVGVSAVEFYIDGDDLIFTDYASPFSYTWNSGWCFNGSHSFTAIAYDGDLQSDSETVSWTTSNAGETPRWLAGFEADPGLSWRIQDFGGSGLWHWLNDAGYDSSGGMRFATPGESNYGNNDSDWLISPIVNLSGITNPYLWFYHKYDIEDGGVEYDKGWVYVTTDLDTWTEVTHFSGQDQPWEFIAGDLAAYSDQNVKLAWYFDADGGLTYTGWWLDNAEVNTKPTITSLNPARAKLGDTVVITGTGFGDGVAFETPLVTVGGITASSSSWTDTEITITVPSGVVSGDNVVVSRGGVASDGAELRIILAPPVLDDVGEIPST